MTSNSNNGPKVVPSRASLNKKYLEAIEAITVDGLPTEWEKGFLASCKEWLKKDSTNILSEKQTAIIDRLIAEIYD